MLSEIRRDSRLKHDPLIDSPFIVRVNDFCESAARDFSKDLAKAVNGGMPIVPVVIDSYGGECYSLLAMIQEIRSCPVPVATIGEGKMMSCGAMLLAMGSRGHRYASPLSHVLLHHVFSFAAGITPKVREDAEQSVRLDRQVFELIAENAGHHPSYFLDRLKEKEGADWFLRPEEAKDLGLIDHVRVPRLVTEVSVKTELQ